MGVGTALIYPVIQAAVSDEVPAEWRGVGIGIYRFCRDMGYVAGALVAGIFSTKGIAIFIASLLLLICSILMFFFFVPMPKLKDPKEVTIEVDNFLDEKVEINEM